MCIARAQEGHEAYTGSNFKVAFPACSEGNL